MVGLMSKIFGGWLLVIMAGMPLYTSMALASLVFLWLIGMPVTILPQKMAGSINSFPIVAAPLFILMGNILNSAGIPATILHQRPGFRCTW